MPLNVFLPNFNIFGSKSKSLSHYKNNKLCFLYLFVWLLPFICLNIQHQN